MPDHNNSLVGSNAFLGNMLDNLNDAVYVLDTDMRVVFWNRAAQNITGFHPNDIVGTPCDNKVQHCDSDGKVLCNEHCPMRAAMREDRTIESTVYLCHRDGHRLPVAVRISPVHDEHNRVVGALHVFSDQMARTAAIRRLEELEHMALNDPLTSVRNRRFMQEQIELRIAEFNRTGESLGCIFLDIDHFKSINDRFGHDSGDAALQIIARTLRNVARPFDAVGRWGGEEFLVLTSGDSPQTLADTASRFCTLISQSRFEPRGQRVPLSASVGATLANPTDTPDTLAQRFDHLMYQSKQLGRNRVTHDLAQAA